MAIAYPTVPVGPFVHDNDGLCDCPSHVNATGMAPPDTMSGLVRVNEDFAVEPPVVVPAATVERVVPAIELVDTDSAAVELGATDVVATESLFVCAEQPAVTRIIQVSEVMIRFFIQTRLRSVPCNGKVMRLRRSEECERLR